MRVALPLCAVGYLCAAAAGRGAHAAKVVPLINGQGTRLVASGADFAALTKGSSELSVVAVVGCKGSGKSALLNEAFGTDFKVRSPLAAAPGEGAPQACAGAVAGADDSLLVLLDCDGTQSAALSAAVSDAIIMNMWCSDVGRHVPSNVATLKALCSECAARESPVPLLIVVHDTPPTPPPVEAAAAAAADSEDAADAADGDSLEAAVMRDLQRAWNEAGAVRKESSKMVSDLFDVTMLKQSHPIYSKAEYQSGGAELKERVLALPRPDTAKSGAELLRQVKEVWGRLRKGDKIALPGWVDLLPVQRIDLVYSEASAEIGRAVNKWRSTVYGSGETVKHFGRSVTQKYKLLVESFDDKTLRYSVTPLRAQRRAELVSFMEGAVEELFVTQLQMLCADALKGYKSELLSLFSQDKLTEDTEADVLRKTLFAFEAAASELVPPVMEDLLGIDGAYEELEADLQDFSDKFPESPAAQLKMLQKVEKDADKGASSATDIKPPTGDTKASISAGLSLVGMIRQIGVGNAQAFGGYRHGPHSVTLGYANDAPKEADDMRGASPVPLLRVQPKIQLDIDL